MKISTDREKARKNRRKTKKAVNETNRNVQGEKIR